MRRFAHKLKNGSYILADRPDMVLSEAEFKALQKLMKRPGQHPGEYSWVVFVDFRDKG